MQASNLLLLASQLGMDSSLKGKTITSTNHSRGREPDSTFGIDSQGDLSIQPSEKIKDIHKKIAIV